MRWRAGTGVEFRLARSVAPLHHRSGTGGAGDVQTWVLFVMA